MDRFTQIEIPAWVTDSLVTDCETVEEFAHKYYKPDRFTGRGQEYVNCCLESHKQSIQDEGFTCLSHHDNVTGRFIAFVPKDK